jgi:hypothetical protein
MSTCTSESRRTPPCRSGARTSSSSTACRSDPA